MESSFPGVSRLSHFLFFLNSISPSEFYTLSYTTLFRSVLLRPQPHTVRFSGRLSGLVGLLRELLLLCNRSLTCRLGRSEEHTSELQSQSNLVCRLLLEKKKTPARHAS